MDPTTGLRGDQTIVLTGQITPHASPEKLRRIKYYEAETGQTLTFLSNHFILPVLSVAQLDRRRWQVGLFFKWIQQHRRIKAFLGTTENAVKTQIGMAVSVYGLVAIIKKRLALAVSRYPMLPVLSRTVFEKMPLLQVLSGSEDTDSNIGSPNQLNLFE